MPRKALSEAYLREVDDKNSLLGPMPPPGSPDVFKARLVGRGEEPRLKFDPDTQAAVLVTMYITIREPIPPQSFSLTLKVPGEAERVVPLVRPPPSGNMVQAERSTAPLAVGQVFHNAFWFDLADLLGSERAKMGTVLTIRYGKLAETTLSLGPR